LDEYALAVEATVIYTHCLSCQQLDFGRKNCTFMRTVVVIGLITMIT